MGNRAILHADIWSLPAADLLGVGRATQKELDRYGIKTIGDLAKTDIDWLQRHFGKRGIVLGQGVCSETEAKKVAARIAASKGANIVFPL